MSALEQVESPQPVIGWRVWRVRRVETLRDGEQVRLCAVGTQGLPPVWEPRRLVRAVCSDHNTRHEAPHPDHLCGFYALRSRSRSLARSHLTLRRVACGIAPTLRAVQ